MGPNANRGSHSRAIWAITAPPLVSLYHVSCTTADQCARLGMTESRQDSMKVYGGDDTEYYCELVLSIAVLSIAVPSQFASSCCRAQSTVPNLYIVLESYYGSRGLQS